MVNAWSLLHSETNGTMDEDYPIMSKDDDATIVGGDGDDTITFTASGLVGGADTVAFDWGVGQDHISFGTSSSVYGEYAGYDTLNIGTPIPGASASDTLNLDFSGIAGTQYDDNKYYADGVNPYPTRPQPDLKSGSTQKYQEDKGIADLQSYVASTYQGHYTNKNSDTQTLDLIHSVGDAESFCRSNAIKYLSRYDKKGSAKQDILKAMHYCLLFYYFSGNTKEPDYTNTRYETF